MPNWCSNQIEFDFTEANPETREMLKKVSDTYNKDGSFGLFESFFPVPTDLKVDHQWPVTEAMIENQKKYGYESWYEWCKANWGTKWDTSDIFLEISENKISGSFQTAWSPPIGFYQFLEENGVKIVAKYVEEGMGFAGFYDNGEIQEIDNIHSDKEREAYLDCFPHMRDFFTDYCIGQYDEDEDEDDN